ncbi:MAG TPA: hypothetical protein VFH56_11020 [Acidimicrobiales bacterium]|nr:hypothetical protein [Acidimicrobiales bacterium]
MTRAETVAKLLAKSHDAGRVSVADERHALMHEEIDRLLGELEAAGA